MKKSDANDELSRIWRHVLDEMPMRTYVKSVDDDLRYVICNKKLCEDSGYKLEDVIGKKTSEVYPEDIAKHFNETTAKTLEINGPHTKNEIDFDTDGARLDLRTTETIFSTTDGHRYVLGFCRDVSDEVNQMNVVNTINDISAIPISECDFLQEIFNIVTRDDRLDVLELRWMSRDGSEYRAIRAAHAVESSVYKPSDEDLKQIWDFHRKHTDRDGIAIYTNFPAIADNVSDDFRAHGHKSMCVLPIITQHSRTIGDIALFFRTPRKFSQRFIDLMHLLGRTISISFNRINVIRDLENQIKRAEEAERARNYFFASVSHDIRTPLNSIIGFSDLLKTRNLDDESKNKYVEAISSSGHLLLNLINDILDLTKLESGMMHFENSMTDVYEMISEICMSFVPQTSAKQIKLKTEIMPDFPSVSIDAPRIRQIINNLVNNAVKFTNNGFVKIAAKFTPQDDKSGLLSFAVIDTGRGISNEDQKRLMMPFVQLMHADQGHGTGLGLAICREIVTQMGGELKIESAVNVGSVFHVSIPNVKFSREVKKKNELSVTQRIKISLNPIRTGKLRLLIADDIPLNLQVLKSMFKRLGVAAENIFTATSGKQALEILNTEGNVFDAVLTDMWMPEMSGEEFIKEVRSTEKLKKLPVYAVTADTGVIKTFEELGFTGCLLKPVSLQSLTDHLKVMLSDIEDAK